MSTAENFLSYLFQPENKDRLRALPEPELVLGIDYEEPIDLWTIACYYPSDTAKAYEMVRSLREIQKRSSARTEFLRRDFTQADIIPPELTGTFDLAHASVVQYLLTPAGRERLLQQMALSLRPGGFLVETDMLDPQFTRAGDLFIPRSIVTRVRRKTQNGLTGPIEIIRYSKYPPDSKEHGTSADCTTWYLNVEGIKQLMSGRLSV